MTKQEIDHKDMIYLRMIKAESALKRVQQMNLTVQEAEEEAEQVLRENKILMDAYLIKYPD